MSAMSFFIVYEFSYKFASLTALQYVCAPKIKKITARQSWAETYGTPCGPNFVHYLIKIRFASLVYINVSLKDVVNSQA